MLPLGLVRGFFFALGLLGVLVFGSALGAVRARSPWRREARVRRAARDRAAGELADLERDWAGAAAEYRRDRLADSVGAIKGFGAALTASLVAWRAGVLAEFRFDPSAAVPPAEGRAVAARFRARQRQLLGESEQALGRLDALPAERRAEIERLAPAIRDALADLAQAEADVTELAQARSL